MFQVINSKGDTQPKILSKMCEHAKSGRQIFMWQSQVFGRKDCKWTYKMLDSELLLITQERHLGDKWQFSELLPSQSHHTVEDGKEAQRKHPNPDLSTCYFLQSWGPEKGNKREE